MLLNLVDRRIKKAIYKKQEDFVKKYKEIKASGMDETERQEKLSKLSEENKTSIKKLYDIKELDKISKEKRECLGIIDEKYETIDEKLVETLVQIYINDVGANQDADIKKFGEELKKYFIEHYEELHDTDVNNFLAEFEADENSLWASKEGEFFKIAQECNVDTTNFIGRGFKLDIQEGLISEDDGENIHYSTQRGINNILWKKYCSIVYKKETGKHSIIGLNKLQKEKNNYLKYAKENGIEIENKEVLEELEVNKEKVQDLANYINRVMRNEGVEEDNNITERIEEEITQKYSEIMNYGHFDFGDLDVIKTIFPNKDWYINGLRLQIEDDHIVTSGAVIKEDIVYGTPEYIKRRYNEVKEKISELFEIYGHSFLDLYKYGVSIEKANVEKRRLERYIKEKDIKDIDISTPEIEINHEITNKIADALMQTYGTGYEDKETMRRNILSKLEENWSQIMTIYPNVDIEEMFEDELREMGQRYVDDTLFVADDFVYISESIHWNDKVIYATPEALSRNIHGMNKKIEKEEFHFDEKAIKEKLEKYAKENGIELDSVEKMKSDKKLTGLDERLTGLQQKEKEAEELYHRYEEQVKDKENPEL